MTELFCGADCSWLTSSMIVWARASSPCLLNENAAIRLLAQPRRIDLAARNEDNAVIRMINDSDDRHKMHQVASTNFSM